MDCCHTQIPLLILQTSSYFVRSVGACTVRYASNGCRVLNRPVCGLSSRCRCLAVCLAVCLSLCLAARLSVCLSGCLSVRLSVCQAVCLSVSLSIIFVDDATDLLCSNWSVSHTLSASFFRWHRWSI
jgi:hypothetical protein